VIPTAHVTPTNAAGTVQFKDGTTNLGNPVRATPGTVAGGISRLSPGQHTLTATFTPTDPTKFKPSTSNTVTFTF
jgi:hypothetical protein